MEAGNKHRSELENNASNVGDLISGNKIERTHNTKMNLTSLPCQMHKDYQYPCVAKEIKSSL